MSSLQSILSQPKKQHAGQVGFESLLLVGIVALGASLSFADFGTATSEVIRGTTAAAPVGTAPHADSSPTVGSTHLASITSAFARLKKLHHSLLYASHGRYSAANHIVEGARAIRTGARRKAVKFDMGYPMDDKLPRMLAGEERRVFPTVSSATANERYATNAFDDFLEDVLLADTRGNLFPALLEAERRWMHAGNAVGPDNSFDVRLVEKAREDWTLRADGIDIGPRVWNLPFFWSDHGSDLMSDLSRVVWSEFDSPSAAQLGPIDADRTSALFSLTPSVTRRGGWKAEIVELTDATHLGDPNTPRFVDFYDSLSLAFQSSRIDNILGEALERGAEAFAFGSGDPVLVRLLAREHVLGRGPSRRPGVVPASSENTLRLTTSEVIVGATVWNPPLQNRYVRPTRDVPF